jgi:hypothetical protein
MSTHGPWITPELLNGWENAGEPHREFQWRIDKDGAFSLTGMLAAPPPETNGQPIMKLHAIYRDFFDSEPRYGVTLDPECEPRRVKVWIDGDGYLRAEVPS